MYALYTNGTHSPQTDRTQSTVRRHTTKYLTRSGETLRRQNGSRYRACRVPFSELRARARPPRCAARPFLQPAPALPSAQPSALRGFGHARGDATVELGERLVHLGGAHHERGHEAEHALAWLGLGLGLG